MLVEYTGVTMHDLDGIRAKVREAGGEFHIVKNTLGKVAFEQAGLPVSEKLLTGSTAIAFAFQDTPAMAKVIADFARTSEFVKIEGGYLEKAQIGPDQVKALAELPPLSVMRAQLLGTLQAPASKLVRTLAEPARALAAVFKAYAEPEPMQSAA